MSDDLSRIGPEKAGVNRVFQIVKRPPPPAAMRPMAAGERPVAADTGGAAAAGDRRLPVSLYRLITERRVYGWEPGISRLTGPDGAQVDTAIVGYPAAPRAFPEAPGDLSAVGKGPRFDRIKIQLGLGCNMACGYCLQAAPRAEGGRGGGQITAFLAGMERWFDGGPDGDGSGVRIEYWGGEPLLYARALRELDDGVRARWPRARRGIVSNGTLLTEALAEWLAGSGMHVAISHDGQGQAAGRGRDPFAEPGPAAAIGRLYEWLRPAGRISFNCVLTAANPSLLAVAEWLAERLGVAPWSVPLTTEGFVGVYGDGGREASAGGEAERRRVRAVMSADFASAEGILSPSIHGHLTGLFAAMASGRPAASIGQKCGMDRPEQIAVDLGGNVITCQNVASELGGRGLRASKSRHHLGRAEDLTAAPDKIRLRTGIHWSRREECPRCPVLPLCKGGCLYQQGDDWHASCDNHFDFYVSILAAALFVLTGDRLIAIAGETIRRPEAGPLTVL